MNRKPSIPLLLQLVVAVILSFAYEAMADHFFGKGWIRYAFGPGVLFLLAVGAILWHRFRKPGGLWDEPLIVLAIFCAFIAVATAVYWFLFEVP